MDASARPKIKLASLDIPPYSPKRVTHTLGVQNQYHVPSMLSEKQGGVLGGDTQSRGLGRGNSGGVGLERGNGGGAGGADGVIKKRRFTAVLKDALVQVRIKGNKT